MNKQTKKFAIGGALIVIISIVVFTSISSDNMTYFRTTAEIAADPEAYANKKIRVMGQIVEGSVTWEPKTTNLNFRIRGEDMATFLDVSYIGSKPDMFKEGQGVVVEGTMGDHGDFTAAKLLVKHSEEYKVEGASPMMQDKYKQAMGGVMDSSNPMMNNAK